MTDSDPAQRAYRFLQALASDLSHKQISFPTFTGATIRVRTALADPAIDAERLAHVISAEPLLPARLIQIANSVAMNPGGKPISDVRNAVLRVGHDVVRSTAVALAMEQLRAAISYVMARKESRLNPDEALFAGLVHDIGRFYLLSRASGYPELVQHPHELDALIHEWHASIGQAVLHEFHVSDATLRAVSDHEDHHPSVPPRQLVDVVTLANRLALQSNPPRYPAHVERDVPGVDNPAWMQSLAESADDIRALLGALRG
jgi:HD-like signal output (HDOD) protein